MAKRFVDGDWRADGQCRSINTARNNAGPPWPVKPTPPCFGHVHASAGVTQVGGTTFVNASSVSSAWKPTRAPVRIELD